MNRATLVGSGGLLVAVALAGHPASAQIVAASRACTDAEKQRSEVVDGHLPFSVIRNGERIDGAIASSTDYRFEVTPTVNVLPDSIRVVTPSGELERIKGARLVTFAMRTGARGELPVGMVWQQEILDAQGLPTDQTCAAFGSAKLTVRDRSHVRLEPLARRALFQLTVRPGRQPASEDSVTYELRVRRGSAVPPSVGGPVSARYTYPAVRLGPLSHSDSTVVPGVGEFRVVPGIKGVNLHGRMLLVPATVPAGQTRRFGFSLRVLQSGKVVGGMRSGARCQGSRRSALVCTHPGLASRP